MIRRGDDPAGGLPRPVRRLLRFAEVHDTRSRRRPQIGLRVAAARAPKLLADATRLVPAARPPTPGAAVPGRPLLRASLPAQAPTFAPAAIPPAPLVSAPDAFSTAPPPAPPPRPREAAPLIGPAPGMKFVIDPDRARAWAEADSASESSRPAQEAGRQRRLVRATAHGPAAPPRGARIVEGPSEPTAPRPPAATPPAPEAPAARPPSPAPAQVAHVAESPVRASAPQPAPPPPRAPTTPVQAQAAPVAQPSAPVTSAAPSRVASASRARRDPRRLRSSAPPHRPPPVRSLATSRPRRVQPTPPHLSPPLQPRRTRR